jgi:hypothetical protein
MGLGLAMALAGCSSSAIEDKLPTSMGGLPAAAPARPAVAPEFLPVHDLPQARDVKPLSDEQRKKLEADLTLVRTRQERLNPNAKAAEQTTAPPAASGPAMPGTR